MVDPRVVINVLVVTCKVQAIKRYFGARIRDADDNVIAHESAAEVEARRRETCIAPHFHCRLRGLYMSQVTRLDAQVRGMCVVADGDPDDGISVVVRSAQRRVVFDDFAPGVCGEFDFNPRLRSRSVCCALPRPAT